MHIAHQLAKVSLDYDALCIHALDLRRRLPAPATDPFPSPNRVFALRCPTSPRLASPRLILFAWAGQEPPNSMSRRECDVGERRGHAFDRGLRPASTVGRLASARVPKARRMATFHQPVPNRLPSRSVQIGAEAERERERERESVCVCMARATMVRLVRGRRTVTNVRNAFLRRTANDLTGACGLLEVATL